MAKRFTDTEKWKKRFIKGLSTVHKLFFFYLLDDCDHAGIWHVEFDVAEIRIGENLNIDEIKEKFKKHIIEIDNGEKWFIPYFVEFQYGELNSNVNAHKSVIDKLSKYKLIKKYQEFINGSSTVKDKDKAMDKDIDTTIYNEIFKYWNEQKIRVHKDYKLLKNGNQKYSNILNNLMKADNDLKSIKIAISNYSKILKSDDYFFQYKWTLSEFLVRGFENFKEWDICHNNYLIKKLKDNSNNIVSEVINEDKIMDNFFDILNNGIDNKKPTISQALGFFSKSKYLNIIKTNLKDKYKVNKKDLNLNWIQFIEKNH